jgi:hypothetical protein
MGVCLLLAYKFNEPVTQRYRIRLDAMLDYIDEEWEISRNEIFDAEFGAFVHLGFSLHVPHQHIYLVYTRLLKLQQKTSRQYLTDEMSDLYTHNILFLEHMKLEHARRLEEAEIEREKLAMMEIVEENNENNDDSNIKEESEVEIEKEPSNEKISSEKISPLRSALATFGRARSLTSSFALIDPIGLTGGNTASDDDQYSPKTKNENPFSVSRSNKSDDNLLAEKPEVSATQSEKSKSILPFFNRRNSNTNNTNTNSSANNTNSSNTTNGSSEALDKL